MATENLKIKVDGAPIQSQDFHSCIIEQEFNAHHSFECLIYADAVSRGSNEVSLHNSKKWIGKLISFDMGTSNMQFEGIICEVQARFIERECIVLKGYSPTIQMSTSGGHYQSFSDLKLDGLVKKVKNEIMGTSLKWAIKPAINHPISYMSQYNENYFDFVNRLSASYGEFFYYDGKVLHFGKPTSTGQVDITFKQGVSDFSISMHALPTKFSQYSHNYMLTNVIHSTAPDLAISNTLAKHAYDQSNSIFTMADNSPAETEVSTKAALEASQKIKRESIASGLIKITGSSREPSLTIGCHANIKIFMGEKKSDAGKFLITRIKHEFSPGKYTNSFEGVLADVDVLHVDNVTYPIAQQQVAHVIENDDPQSLGRVKVRLLWQDEKSTTGWIRIMTPYAGGGERGILFIPLPGDEVIVGFDHGNPDLPFVVGSVFNKKHNAITPVKQSITTQHGSELVFFNNGTENYIRMSDQNGNQILIDTTSNLIKIISEGNIEISARDNINFVANAFNISANKLFELNAEHVMIACENFEALVAGSFILQADSISETAATDFTCVAKNNLEHVAGNNLSYRTETGDMIIDALETVTLRGKTIV